MNIVEEIQRIKKQLFFLQRNTGGGGGGVWGAITGTLSSQTDLNTALNNKANVPTGTPDGTKYLRDDNTWQPVSGGSGLEQYQVRRIIRR